VILWSSHSQTRKTRAGKNCDRRRRSRCEIGKWPGRTNFQTAVLGALKRGNGRTSVPAIAGALTDLAEINKFVKEQAEAIPLDEAAVLYRL
jgi:hypothetical protein